MADPTGVLTLSPSGTDLNLSNFGTKWWLHDMFLGPFGSGKTRQVCRIAEDPEERVFIYDFQGGILVGMDLPFEYETIREKSRASPMAASAFTLHWNTLMNAAIAGKDTFQAKSPMLGKVATYKTPTVVVLDPLTYLDHIVMNQVQSLREKGVPGNPPTIADYGHLGYNIERFMDEAVAAPFHFIMVAHMKMMKDEITGQIRSIPMASGDKMPQKIGGYFLQIWHFDCAYGKYSASAVSSPTTPLKALLNLFPSVIDLTEAEGLPGDTESLWMRMKNRIREEAKKREASEASAQL